MYLKWLHFYKINVQTKKGMSLVYHVIAGDPTEALKMAKYAMGYYYPKIIFDFNTMKCDSGRFILSKRS